MAGIIVAVVVADLLWCCKSVPIRLDAVAFIELLYGDAWRCSC